MKEQRYRNWQDKLSKNSYRRFWVFWAIYAPAIIFIIGGVFLIAGFGLVVLKALLAFIVARVVLSPLIYLVYKKSRPYQQYKFNIISSWFFSPQHDRNNAFPSDHAASLVAISTTFFYYNPAVGIGMVVIAIFNGCARVILGYHDEWDILGGWGVGALSAIGVQIAFLRIFTRL